MTHARLSHAAIGNGLQIVQDDETVQDRIDAEQRQKCKIYRRFYSPSGRGTIYVGDALAFLRSIESASAGLVFLDPPFNLGKQYLRGKPKLDRLPEDEYQEWLTSILVESIRVLAPGGALYLYHLPIWAMRFGAFLDTQLTLRHWIAVSMKNGFVRGQRLYPAHYALLYFTKEGELSFQRPKVQPSLCRHCGGMVKDYGGYKQIIEEKGINLSDVWEDVSPVRHAHLKWRTQNQLPLTLTDRVMEISGTPGMLMVDPFAGSGSSVVSAASYGLRFAACDIVTKNCRIISEKLLTRRQPLRG
jgi:site-specific DNA-methyltransferase (adenine-specific)